MKCPRCGEEINPKDIDLDEANFVTCQSCGTTIILYSIGGEES